MGVMFAERTRPRWEIGHAADGSTTPARAGPAGGPDARGPDAAQAASAGAGSASRFFGSRRLTTFETPSPPIDTP